MKTELDIESWNRKEHFEFFSSFDEPFFGITSTVDFTRAYQKIKDNKYPYFLYYLYASLQAANAIEPFRYRIEGQRVLYMTSFTLPPLLAEKIILSDFHLLNLIRILKFSERREKKK